MTDANNDIKAIHSLIDMLQNIDVGLVVLERDYNVSLWNTFMENHSGLKSSQVVGKNLFKQFKDLPEAWLRRKLETVFMLNYRAFTIWEQRPYLFHFKNVHPITGTAEFMYQNTTILPLSSADGNVNQVGILIYDVTNIAISRTRLQQANQQLEQLSRIDRLTELFNRGYWEEFLLREFNRLERSQESCSLVMFDIDHFKDINDTYGHPVGDEVIRQVADTLRTTQRSTDLSARYGGEEFVVLLPNSDKDGALYFAERLRKKIAKLAIPYEDKTIHMTISLGIAAYGPGFTDYQQWLKSADIALYDAKHQGRNRSVVYQLEGN